MDAMWCGQDWQALSAGMKAEGFWVVGYLPPASSVLSELLRQNGGIGAGIRIIEIEMNFPSQSS